MSNKATEVTRIPFMDVQPNWHEVIRDSRSTAKFWISCRKPGEKTIHDSLSKPSGDGSAHHQNDQFFIRDQSQRSITVECPEAHLTTTFVRPKKTLHLHDKKLISMDVSSSGGLGVCSSEDGRLWVWDADTGETRRSLEGHVGDVYTCQFFPSGIVVLSGAADLRLRIWSAQDGSCPRTLTGHTRGISDAAIIDRGRNIVSVSSDGSAKLWDCGSAKCLATLATTGCPVNACDLINSQLLAQKNTIPPTEPEYGTCDKLLLLACEDGSLRSTDIRNRQNWELLLTCSAMVHPDEQNTTRVFSLAEDRSPLTCCSFVSDSQALCGAEDGTITVVDLRHPAKFFRRVSFGSSSVTALTSMGEGKCLCSFADGSCFIWKTDDCSTQKSVTKLTGPELDTVSCVKNVMNDIYTSCRDGCVRVYSCIDVSI